MPVPLPRFDTLSPGALAIAKVPGDWPFGIADAVRFNELDVLNHANNAAYVSWLENVRIAYFMDYGITDYVSEDRPTIVMRNLEIDFREPLHLAERYVVTARSVEYGRSSWRMENAIFRDGAVAATATCILVTTTPDGRAAAPLRPGIIEAITTRDGARPRG
ncbi:acyl-CoA thioesterase [Rhodobacteraceae bacterium W635]|nr:acyl-CoA thioesterase [Rhodobacteraceae bacterium W635]